MEHIPNEKYNGGTEFGRFEGEGMYVFQDGSRYVGGFKNGTMHGKGTLYLPQGQFTGTWENGKQMDGNFTFDDGLKYSSSNWEYCSGNDRRFHSEYQRDASSSLHSNNNMYGIKPAGWTQHSNHNVDPILPTGCYDAGIGFFDPNKNAILDYSSAVHLKNTSEQESIDLQTYARISKHN